MLIETAQANEDTVYNAAPKINIGRRPYLSLSGPNKIIETANTKKKIVSVNPTRNSLAEKYSLIIGKAGKNKSVDSGINIPI